jgi:hypothetical protein
MKWFQVDSDSPADPKIKAVIRKGLAEGGSRRAAELVGHVFLLWCYVANHGEAQPGLGVKADGEPLSLAEMTDECLFENVDDLRCLLDFLAVKGHIDHTRWVDHGIVFLPGMLKRADTYAKRKGRGVQFGNLRTKHPVSPLQDKTVQNTEDQTHVSPADLLADAGEDQVDALVRVWNTDRLPGPKVSVLTDSRRRVFARALKATPDLNDWRLVILWLNRQPWCNAKGGDEHANWRATLDWLAKPGKLAEKLDLAKADRATVRADGTTGRNAAKGRTGTRPGQYAAAVKGGGDDGAVH